MFLKSACTAIALCAALPVAAQDGGYTFRAWGGLSLLGDTDITTPAGTGDASFGGGQILGGAIGYDYANSPWRTELEFSYRSGEDDSLPGGSTGDYASTILMVNGIYDLPTQGAFTPYIGGGVGYVTEIDFDLEDAAVGEYADRGGLALQLMGGASYALSQSISAFGEVRALRVDTPDLSGSASTIDAHYGTVDLLVGLQPTF